MFKDSGRWMSCSGQRSPTRATRPTYFLPAPQGLYFTLNGAKHIAFSKADIGDSLATGSKVKELTAGTQGLTLAPGRTSFFLL